MQPKRALHVGKAPVPAAAVLRAGGAAAQQQAASLGGPARARGWAVNVRSMDSLQQAIAGGAGIVIQFPFYAGIMAIMVQSGLAQSMSQWFISFASAESLAFWSFISAGIVNIFVPSGGGQWAVQAPVMLPAALELGADISRIAMAVAWGDAWTNLIQPFWALPVLAIAGLKAKDIMGYCLLQLIVTGVIISLVLSFA